MKKILCILLLVVLVLALGSCATLPDNDIVRLEYCDDIPAAFINAFNSNAEKTGVEADIITYDNTAAGVYYFYYKSFGVRVFTGDSMIQGFDLYIEAEDDSKDFLELAQVFKSLSVLSAKTENVDVADDIFKSLSVFPPDEDGRIEADVDYMGDKYGMIASDKSCIIKIMLGEWLCTTQID